MSQRILGKRIDNAFKYSFRKHAYVLFKWKEAHHEFILVACETALTRL